MKLPKNTVARAIFLATSFACISPLRAEGIGVVSENELGHFWKPPETEFEFIELDGSRVPSHGCISIGILIEKDGMVSEQPGLLRFAFSKAWQRKTADAVTSLAGQSYAGPYSLVDEEATVSTVFTSRSFAVLSESLEKKLPKEELQRLADKLEEVCRIDDLRAWLREHRGSVESLPQLPSVDELLQQ